MMTQNSAFIKHKYISRAHKNHGFECYCKKMAPQIFGRKLVSEFLSNNVPRVYRWSLKTFQMGTQPSPKTALLEIYFIEAKTI